MSALAIISVIGLGVLLATLIWSGREADREELRRIANYWAVRQQRRGWPR